MGALAELYGSEQLGLVEQHELVAEVAHPGLAAQDFEKLVVAQLELVAQPGLAAQDFEKLVVAQLELVAQPGLGPMVQVEQLGLVALPGLLAQPGLVEQESD